MVVYVCCDLTQVVLEYELWNEFVVIIVFLQRAEPFVDSVTSPTAVGHDDKSSSADKKLVFYVIYYLIVCNSVQV